MRKQTLYSPHDLLLSVCLTREAEMSKWVYIHLRVQ